MTRSPAASPEASSEKRFFRMASLVLEDARRQPRVLARAWRGSDFATDGFNRLIFGDRFKAVFPSRDPAIFHWVRLGGGAIVSNKTGSHFF